MSVPRTLNYRGWCWAWVFQFLWSHLGEEGRTYIEIKYSTTSDKGYLGITNLITVERFPVEGAHPEQGSTGEVSCLIQVGLLLACCGLYDFFSFWYKSLAQWDCFLSAIFWRRILQWLSNSLKHWDKGPLHLKSQQGTRVSKKVSLCCLFLLELNPQPLHSGDLCFNPIENRILDPLLTPFGTALEKVYPPRRNQDRDLEFFLSPIKNIDTNQKQEQQSLDNHIGDKKIFSIFLYSNRFQNMNILYYVFWFRGYPWTQMFLILILF